TDAKTEEYIRVQTGILPHEPINLWSLPEPKRKRQPPGPFHHLAKVAIWASKEKQMTQREIEEAVIERFAWYRDH
ncbi:hypothetical protein C8R43DRAFT_865026, partial [Mycena crocata]